MFYFKLLILYELFIMLIFTFTLTHILAYFIIGVDNQFNI